MSTPDASVMQRISEESVARLSCKKTNVCKKKKGGNEIRLATKEKSKVESQTWIKFAHQRRNEADPRPEAHSGGVSVNSLSSKANDRLPIDFTLGDLASKLSELPFWKNDTGLFVDR
jgi:hypothetical protein